MKIFNHLQKYQLLWHRFLLDFGFQLTGLFHHNSLNKIICQKWNIQFFGHKVKLIKGDYHTHWVVGALLLRCCSITLRIWNGPYRSRQLLGFSKIMMYLKVPTRMVWARWYQHSELPLIKSRKAGQDPDDRFVCLKQIICQPEEQLTTATNETNSSGSGRKRQYEFKIKYAQKRNNEIWNGQPATTECVTLIFNGEVKQKERI